MKQLILWVSFMLTLTNTYCQTDQLNQQKYWKMRDALREDFVKISGEVGGSIVARSLMPNSCWNNLNEPNNGGNTLGEMIFGDGMIRHGYYLGLLATEYKLLKDAGQDTKGVLNELYYALEAINRLDLNAEIEQSQCYEFTENGSLNGFYQREDIPDYFAHDNWGNTDMRMECVNSPHFKTNNAQKLNAPAGPGTPEFEASPNSYQNSPSIDQLSSLMLGFRLVHKLVDNELVQPTSESDGIYIITELKAIVDRIMTYVNDRNWMIVDVNGWPVNNGGGDLFWCAYPLSKAAYIITDHSYHSDWTRRLVNLYLKNIQYCVTGFGVDDTSEGGRNLACAKGQALFPPGQPLALGQLQLGDDFGENNNQNNSVYQDWLADGPFHGDANLLFGQWNDPDLDIVGYSSIAELIVKKTTIFGLFMEDLNDEAAPVGDGENDRNFGILFSNLATAGSTMTKQKTNSLTNVTGNKQIDLINAVLTDDSPVGDREFFKSFLDAMNMNGAYNFNEKNGSLVLSKPAPGGWASEDRWTWSSHIYGGTQSEGIFNGIDYMLFHNLYRLVFPDDQPVFSPESAEECFCNSQVNYPIPNPLPSYVPINEFNILRDQLNGKLQHIQTCTEDVFEKVNYQVTGTFTIEPYFSNYDNMDIYTNKFEMEDVSILNTGSVYVNTPFILCNNSKLTMQSGSLMKIVKKHVSVNNGSTIDLSGELYVQPGTELRIKAGGHLILRPGSKLILHENCAVIIENGATLTYYNGATIYTKNDDSGKLIIRGNLNLENNAVFSIDHSFSTTSGLIVFDGKPTINAQPGAKIDLTSKGKNDLIIQLTKNTKVYFADTDLQEVKLTDCGVDINATNSFIRFQQPVNTLRVKFTGNNLNAGQLYVTDVNLFRQTDFVNTHVGGEMDIENNATLRMVSCNFTQTLPYYANGSGIDVHGRGYSLTSCNFNIYANGNAMVESQKLTLNSTVSGCVFADINAGNIGQTAIYDVSNADILVASSTFNTLRNAIDKTTGKLTLRCNTFTNSRDNSVTMRGGLLNMAIGTGGGYNTFSPMTGTLSTRCHIYLEKALIDMSYGSNYLRDVPVAGGLVRGTLQTTCVSASSCNLDFSGNQWNPVFLITPAATRFSIKSANNINVAVNTLVPMQKASCGSLDVINGFASVLGSTVNALLNQLPTYYSQIADQNLRLDQGIQEAMNKMTALNDGVGNDLEAMAYLDEIFRSNISYSQGNAVTQKLMLQAKSHMKLALESAMALDLITPDQNVYNFEANTEDFVNSANRVTNSSVTESNYFRQFYNELDKAQVLRAIGKPEKSLELLTELESCGLDFMEQSLVNREKKYAMKDIRIEQLGLAFLDTVYVPDTSSFIAPAHFAGDYHFGSIIQSLNEIDYQNCMGSKSLVTDPVNTLEVFPNPASEEITIRFSYQAMEGEAVIQIYQQDGRLLTSSILNELLQNEWTTNVSNWTPGTYQYVYTRPDGMRYSGVFVVI